METKQLENLAINTLRMLGVDMINKAKSGHPGIVLGSAPIAYTLFTRHLRINPDNKQWWNRDRFILSAGHGSALLYALLYVSGYGLTIDDLKNFRQLGSITPGHPEYKHTPGVEMTTGPLGQGISTACGMALAEAYLANHFNKDNLKPIDHYTYVLCGDGDLQEGIAMEAASFAGHLKLNKLIVLYDSNDIQLDGEVDLANTESTKMKFEAMNWSYILVKDGNDTDAIDKAIIEAKKSEKPTIIEIKTVIGYGAPNSGTNACHGSPLGEENTKALRKYLEYPYEPFEVSEEVLDLFKKKIIERGYNEDCKYSDTLLKYKTKYPDLYKELNDYMYQTYKVNEANLPSYKVGESESTRKILGKMLDYYSQENPTLIGGSADLTPSTFVKGANGNFEPDFLSGRNIRFGVREHAMGAIVNGINLHGGLKAFGAGFFVFSDYMKPAIRLASIMKLPSVFIFSHDSVCVGEDGPTHQPIEHFAMLRSIPNLNVIRPADANEVKGALNIAFNSLETPTVITTSRQALPVLENTSADLVKRGAYVLYETNKDYEGIIISCGSELSICLDAIHLLEEEGHSIRLVSMPCPHLFDLEDKFYKESVLPKDKTRRLAVEMGASMPWYKYASNVKGIDTFGISAPIKHIHKYFGFTKEDIKDAFEKI